MQTDSVLVKICGITNPEDALLAVEYGVDILGVILDDRIVRHGDESLIQEIKNYGVPVAGVYTDFKSIGKKVMYEDIVQLHFDHSTEQIALIKNRFGKRVISVVKYSTPEETRAKCREYANAGTDFILIEKKDGIEEVLEDIMLISGEFKISVAGKISPENIRKFLAPNIEMIDLSSSLEKYPGKKDREKVKRLFERVRENIANIQ